MVDIALLQRADIFYELTATQLQLIASICEQQMFQPGDILFEENTVGQALYVIAQGEVEIQVRPATLGNEVTTPTTIATLRPGQSFGEVSLVDRGLRSAIARCAQPDTTLLMIPHEKLLLLCDSYPQLGYRLMRNLAADLAMKIRNTDLQVRQYLTWTKRR